MTPTRPLALTWDISYDPWLGRWRAERLDGAARFISLERWLVETAATRYEAAATHYEAGYPARS